MTEQRIFTVSELNEFLRTAFRDIIGSVVLTGEVSGHSLARERMVFFDLKDAHARISCFCMAWEIPTLVDGQEIRLFGYPSLFQRSGKFHIRVVSVELIGQGVLQQAFEKLRAQLEREGLFSPERKRSLPEYPERIGLVTSSGAAAYTDVVQKLADRWPYARVLFLPASVQGVFAVPEIVAAITAMERQQPDVLLLVRGGGSLEDLQAFNDERIARAIFRSSIPVVTGIGHERDTTIADFVADRRASTPTNAAELASPDRRVVVRSVYSHAVGMRSAMKGLVDTERFRLSQSVQNLQYGFVGPLRALDDLTHQFRHAFNLWYHQRVAQGLLLPALVRRMINRVTEIHAWSRKRTDALARLLVSFSPKETLKRGYTITRKNGRVLKRVAGLQSPDSIQTEFSDGSIISIVQSQKP